MIHAIILYTMEGEKAADLIILWRQIYIYLKFSIAYVKNTRITERCMFLLYVKSKAQKTKQMLLIFQLWMGLVMMSGVFVKDFRE